MDFQWAIAYSLFNGALGNNDDNWEDGLNYRHYFINGAVSTFTESTSGINQAWDISGLTEEMAGVSYLNRVPTASELLLYPGTYMVTTGTTNTQTASKTYSNGNLLTSYSDTELTLNYSSDPIDLGYFPKNYGSTFSDLVAGTYVIGGYSGTFTGTFVTSFDAYGTMTFNAFEAPDVMRLKTVETLDIMYPGLGSVGTFVQTTYRYYLAYDGFDYWPYVKSTNRVIVIPALNIDSNVTQIEKAYAALLSVPNVAIEGSLSLFPNPATNSITVSSSQEIISLTIVDQLGKVVLTKNKTTTLDVSGLQSGIYFIKIVTDGSSGVKKFVKN